ncbi:MAG: 3-dehydroquinate synthase [Opitutus sp.]|nr:3-dehydroquinate synthase [Opitutus sp.]
MSAPSSLPFSPNTVARLSLDDALASARETKVLKLGRDQLASAPAVFREQFPGRNAWIISDTVVHPIAGQTVQDLFVAEGLTALPPFLFSCPEVYAEHAFVEQLESALKLHDAVPVAVGSGTINDIVKLAAHRLHRPYLCVATAASMDGYTAFGASITFRGAKQTFQCPAPAAVVADIDIVRRAPPEMTGAGYADLLAKVTAGADWIVADSLGQDKIDPRAWAIVQGGLKQALADPEGARHGQPEAIFALTEGLMLGGFAMQWSKSSRPASGAEHQFSHLWDMEHHVHGGTAPSHGFKVGLATLAVTALYEELLKEPLEHLDEADCCRAWLTPEEAELEVRRCFAGSDFVETAVLETRAKQCSREELARELQILRGAWPDLSRRLKEQLFPLADLRDRLRRVGAPTHPTEIGLTPERVRQSFRRAYHIRRRFTVLDLAVRTQTLEPCLDRIFGPGGLWSSS